MPLTSPYPHGPGIYALSARGACKRGRAYFKRSSALSRAELARGMARGLSDPPRTQASFFVSVGLDASQGCEDNFLLLSLVCL